MRRSALLLILLIPAVAGFSAGVGIGVSGGYVIDEMGTSLASLSVSSETRSTHVPMAAFLYADADFFLARLGYAQYLFGHELWTQTAGGTLTTLMDAGTGMAGYVTLSLFARYPFPLGAVSIAPLAGFEFDTNVLLIDAGGADLRASLSDSQKLAQNRAWLKAGASLEIAVTDHAYLRGDFLLGYRLPSSAERNAVLAAEQAGFDVTLFALWPEIGILAGVKF